MLSVTVTSFWVISELLVNSPSIFSLPLSPNILPSFTPPFVVTVPELSIVPLLSRVFTVTSPLLVNLSSSVLIVSEFCSNDLLTVTSPLTLFPLSSVYVVITVSPSPVILSTVSVPLKFSAPSLSISAVLLPVIVTFSILTVPPCAFAIAVSNPEYSLTSNTDNVFPSPTDIPSGVPWPVILLSLPLIVKVLPFNVPKS